MKKEKEGGGGSYRPWSFRLRVAGPLLLFGVAGYVLLGWLLWRNHVERSGEELERLAGVNAAFLRAGDLPTSERMAASLSEVLGMNAAFVKEGEPAEATGIAGQEATAEVRAGEFLRLARSEPKVEAFLAGPVTTATSAAYWAVVFGAAVWLAAGYARPLRGLAAEIAKGEAGDEPGEVLPGEERSDEVGLLARALSRARREARRERAARERAEREAVLAGMAANLAHEIQNPVSAIRMRMELLAEAETEELAEEAGEAARVTLREARRIESLVNQWKYLLRPEPPSTSLRDAGDLLAEAKAGNEALLRHAGVRAEMEVEEENLAVEVDGERMAQALDNLVRNAVHAMNEGGVLRLRAFRCEEAGGVSLQVSDEGPGFSEEALTRAAEPFYSTKEGGMGLGLAVCAAVAEALDGSLRFANKETGGAEVTLWLPATEGKAASRGRTEG